MTQTIGLFALGVLLLALGADSFVKGMQGLALRVRASLFAVGASVAAFAGARSGSTSRASPSATSSAVAS